MHVEVRNTDGETDSEIDDLLPSSLRQSRCLWTSATPSASRQPASTSALGGARALPSPDLTVDEIDTLAEVGEVAAVEMAEQITRCSSNLNTDPSGETIPYKFLLHPLLSAEPDLNPAMNGT